MVTLTFPKDDRGEPLYYALTPVYDQDDRDGFQLQTAALVSCMASGRTLAGMGGGGLALAPSIVDALDMARNGYRARVVCDANDFDEMRDILTALVKPDGDREELVRRASDLLARLS